jgi:hypothetical protein
MMLAEVTWRAKLLPMEERAVRGRRGVLRVPAIQAEASVMG